MKNRGKNYFNKVVLLQVIINIMIILVLLVVTEFTLRYFNETAKPKAFEPHPTLYWKLTPNLRNYEYRMDNLSCLIDTNADGFRNEKLDVARNERSFRILCLGDETTFGTGVKQSETFAKVLQTIIRKRYHFFITEVINAGVEGYTSYQGLRFLEEYCLKYKPDIIVVAYLHNDLSYSSRSDKERISGSPLAQKVKKNLYKLQTFMTIRNFLLGQLYERSRKDQDSAGVQRVSPGDYRKNLEAISELAAKVNARLIFLNLQGEREVREPPIYRRSLKKIAEAKGHWLDIYSDFQLNPDYYLAGSHVPNKAGHKLIGEKLFYLIQSKNMIPQRPGGVSGIEKPGAPPPQGGNQGGNAPPPPGGQIQPPPPGQQPPGQAPPSEGPGHPPGSDNFYF